MNNKAFVQMIEHSVKEQEEMHRVGESTGMYMAMMANRERRAREAGASIEEAIAIASAANTRIKL